MITETILFSTFDGRELAFSTGTLVVRRQQTLDGSDLLEWEVILEDLVATAETVRLVLTRTPAPIELIDQKGRTYRGEALAVGHLVEGTKGSGRAVFAGKGALDGWTLCP